MIIPLILKKNTILNEDNLGILLKKKDLNLKQFDNELNFKDLGLSTKKEEYIFRSIRNENINTIDHPAFALNYEENSENILCCYILVTHGDKYKLVYLDIKHNLVIVRDKLVDTVKLKYIGVGHGISIRNIETGIII